MKLPSKNTSTRELRRLHKYTTAQVKAGPDTKDLEPPLQTSWVKLEEADARYLAAEDFAMSVMALRDRADGDADDLLRQLYRELQGKEGGKGLGPMGKVIFGKGLTAVTNVAVKDQPSEMDIVAGRASGAPDQAIAGYAPAVREKAATLKARNDEYDAALAQVGVAFTEVLRCRLDWIRIYEKTYAALLDRMGKAKAERFFRKATKRKAGKKKDEPEA